MPQYSLTHAHTHSGSVMAQCTNRSYCEVHICRSACQRQGLFLSSQQPAMLPRRRHDKRPFSVSITPLLLAVDRPHAKQHHAHDARDAKIYRLDASVWASVAASARPPHNADADSRATQHSVVQGGGGSAICCIQHTTAAQAEPPAPHQIK